MRVSIIIPALNEAARIHRAITTAWEAGADEVIVVDGGSEDETRESARELECQLLEAPRGRASQQNAGAERATGDVFVFQHADNWLAPDSVGQIRQRLHDPRVVCGAFRQRIEARGWSYRLLEWGNYRRAKWLRLPYGDQGIFVRRETFIKVGGFPDIPLMEDVALMRRLARHARPVLLPGPLYVDARRWQSAGVIRQTLRNWWLLTAYYCGVSPRRLAKTYAAYGGEHRTANIEHRTSN